jgi:cysteine synthase
VPALQVISGKHQMAALEPEKYFYVDQYNNLSNWQAQYNGTAPEILEQIGGSMTHFLAELGTSWTFI